MLYLFICRKSPHEDLRAYVQAEIKYVADNKKYEIPYN